ncbi:MAG: hypothetical protein NTV61_01780 [Candidatus Bathyarchaeota archaeon]|nr:hypothetical protein [Candidatus Bathyarchaeota archaeon]
MSYQETREEENLRTHIEQLKTEERVIRDKRQVMEAQLRRLIWHRMMKRVETLKTVAG